MELLAANKLLQYLVVLIVASSHTKALIGVVDARTTRQPRDSTTDDTSTDVDQTTPSGETPVPRESVRPSDQRVDGGCANASNTRSNGTRQSTNESQQIANRSDVTNNVRRGHSSYKSAQVTAENLGDDRVQNQFLIEWTVFGDWRVLVGLGAFEVFVYVVTVTVVMVLHSRQKNQVGSFRDGALTSKYQFTL